MKINEIKHTSFSVRIYGENFKYVVRTCNSKCAGMSFLILDLPDVNGEPMP